MSAAALISIVLVLVALIFMGSLLAQLSRPADDAKASSETMLIDAVNAVLPQSIAAHPVVSAPLHNCPNYSARQLCQWMRHAE